ncbi:MAG: glycosyltransferase [Chlorobi bacterium]|nr:glycosyltransferase [Chlorobiota bacterium]
MIILAAAFFLLSFIYVIFSSLIHYTLLNAPSGKEKQSSQDTLQISVIIAAKNEEANIPRLISSLKKLNYPENKFEVIIVDDNSTDSTRDIISESGFKLVRAENKNLPAKKGALELGIKKASFDFILITDADCVVPADWLTIASDYFSSGTDFVFGAAPYFKGNTLAAKVASFENLRIHMLMFAAAFLGKPYSAAGRNFGFKKESFEKLNGYNNTTETLSGDDDLLLREAVKRKMKIKPILRNNFFVFSDAPEDFKTYFKQKARHVKTSRYYSKGAQATLAIWHSINILITFSVFLIPFAPLLFFPFFIKFTADTAYAVVHQKKFGFKFGFGIPLYQFMYELFLVVHFVNSLFREDNWR